MAYFSSRGPRLGDGAVKPDVVAPGVDIIAARAAGTSLGGPVDEYYTTPQRHLDGDAARRRRRRDPQAGAPGLGRRADSRRRSSAAPCRSPAATAFDAGTGRVDALRAIDATVVAGAALNLGFYPGRSTTSAPTQHAADLHEPGAAPVTLALAWRAEDGAAGAPPGVTLSASTPTVPAGGTATRRRPVRPERRPASGTYSGVVIADPGAGHVRCAPPSASRSRASTTT